MITSNSVNYREHCRSTKYSIKLSNKRTKAQNLYASHLTHTKPDLRRRAAPLVPPRLMAGIFAIAKADQSTQGAGTYSGRNQLD